MPHIPRDVAARLGQGAVAILQTGHYLSPSGARVEIRTQVEKAVGRTMAYPPDREVQCELDLGLSPRISVENQTVLEVGRRMAADGPVVALNFASAESPGGGFLSGARAQEEAIARSSGLFACLEHQPMYEFHRQRRDAMGTDYVIYSPDVPVFRTDDGALLEEPWPLSIITCAAANASALKRYAPQRLRQVLGVMQVRTHKVLATAAFHGHRRIVLGAWGCGAFGIPPVLMAGVFQELLATSFAKSFDEVTFAIVDWSEDQRTIGPFQAAFEE